MLGIYQRHGKKHILVFQSYQYNEISGVSRFSDIPGFSIYILRSWKLWHMFHWKTLCFIVTPSLFMPIKIYPSLSAADYMAVFGHSFLWCNNTPKVRSEDPDITTNWVRSNLQVMWSNVHREIVWHNFLATVWPLFALIFEILST